MIRPADMSETEALEHLFTPLRDATAVLVAVSGGPDSVALLHLDSLASVAGRPAKLDPTLQHMINAGVIDQVVLPDEVHANLVLVHDAEVLGFAPGTPSGIRGSQVVIEADPAWAPAAAHCAAEARRLFGVEPHWAPTDAASRATAAASARTFGRGGARPGCRRAGSCSRC